MKSQRAASIIILSALGLGLPALALGGCGADRKSAAASVHGLVVHEWGTFTSLQGSNGKIMEGLHHTDELLPAFVHARVLAGGQAPDKGMESLPEPVNQKLETPVIYFYGDVPRASVEVGFPLGVISEWYPGAAMMAPAVGGLTQVANGRMRWDFALAELDDVSPPRVDATSVWSPSRKVASLGIRAAVAAATQPNASVPSAKTEEEGFIFYRGLGRFDLPFRVETIAGGMLRISNDSDDLIPAAYMLHVHEGGGAVAALGAIPPHGSIIASPTPKEHDLDHYARVASALLATSLEATGLYKDEALAMVNTWQKSYFQTFGLRVLYVVPRPWTDKLLPITVSPTPTEMVRTLVGRVEVLTAGEEDLLLGRVKTATLAGERLTPAQFGRFAEPKLRRTLELVPAEDVAVRQVVQQLIDAAKIAP